MQQQVRLQLWNRNMRQATRYPAKPRANGFRTQVEESNGCSGANTYDDCSGNAHEKPYANSHYNQRGDADHGRCPVERIEIRSDRAHPMKEIAGDMFHPESKEIANLRARDENGDAIREPDYNG